MFTRNASENERTKNLFKMMGLTWSNSTARSPFYYRCHLWTQLMTLVQIVPIGLGQETTCTNNHHDDAIGGHNYVRILT